VLDIKYKDNMTKRIFCAIFFTLLFAMIITSAIAIAMFYNEYEKRLDEDLNIGLRFLSSVADNDLKELESINVEDRRITLISPDGNVIYDSEADSNQLENHLDRKEVSDAFLHGAGYDSRSSSTIGQKYIYKAVLLTSGNVLRLSAPANTLSYFVLAVLLPLCLSLFALLVFSVFLASFIARRITTPINNLNLDDPVEITGYPELTPLLVRISKQQEIIRRQLEDARRKASEFSLITNNMQEGLVVLDKMGMVLSLNDATKSLFHNNSVKPGDDILKLSRSVVFTSVISNVLNNKSDSVHIEQCGRILEVIANPVVNNGVCAGAVLIFIDITEKEKREAMRREFTANVSHELKTPLTVISGFAEIMKDKNLQPNEVHEYSSEIFNQVQRLISLVHDIIKLSELDEKNIKSGMESLDVSTIASSALRSLEAKAEQNNVNLSLTVENEKKIKGNPALLEEMIYNLLDNAIRYNRPNGFASVSITSDEKYLYLCVTDNGIGIPEQDIDRVFERFYRVDKSRSRENGGTGLGLSIVRHVAEYHKATIKLTSKIGEGTKVEVAFPIEA